MSRSCARSWKRGSSRNETSSREIKHHSSRDFGGKAGVRVTADLTDSWSLEGTYSFSGNDLRITELDEVPPKERFFGIGVHQFVFNGLYYITPPGETLRFFFTAGIGWVRFSPSETATILALVDKFIDDSASIRTSNKFGFNFGAGMETRTPALPPF